MRAPRQPNPTPSGPEVLVAEKLHGLRRWAISVDAAGRLRLGGFGQRLWQTDGEATEAQCARGSLDTRVHAEKAPAGGCQCGLYSVHPCVLNDDHWSGWLPPGRQLAVAGLVECWGTTRVHREGIRAEFARPVRLFCVGVSPDSEYGRFVSELAAAHAAELAAVKSVRAIARHCADSGIGFSVRVLEELLGPEVMRIP